MSTGSNRQGIDYKFVFELRYDYGYTYLDRCGATMNEILRTHPGWEHVGVSPQQGTLRDTDRDLTFNFSIYKLDLSQELTLKTMELMEIEKFAGLANELAETVVARLDVQENITRIGFRIWQLFGRYETFDAAREAVKSLGLLDTRKFGDAGIGRITETSCSMITDREICCTRIAITPVEQKVHVDPATVQKALVKPHKLSSDQRRALIDKVKADRAIKSFPPFAVLVDMDHFLEYPPYPDHLRVADDLIVPCYRWSKDTAAKLI